MHHRMGRSSKNPAAPGLIVDDVDGGGARVTRDPATSGDLHGRDHPAAGAPTGVGLPAIDGAGRTRVVQSRRQHGADGGVPLARSR